MVQFRVNHLLRDLITASELNQTFVACSPRCDRQIIYTTGIQRCLDAVNTKADELDKQKVEIEQQIQKMEEEKKAESESKEKDK
jgi:hypothetical protein